jgi:hypothetical protein
MQKTTHGGLNAPRDPREPGRPQERPTKGGPGAQSQPWPGGTARMGPVPDHGEDSYVGSGRLEGRVALVTGGDSGIGRAVAIAFAREGAEVAVAYLEEHDDARETVRWVEQAGRRGLTLSADLTRHAACRDIVQMTVRELGRLDIVVNNAAYQMETSGIEELTPEQVERTFRTNIMAYIYVAQAALEHLPPGGVILNTGSVTAMDGHPSLIDYAATKGAIHTFTRSLALAVADRGVRVNAVAPGPVWTPLIPATLDEDHVAKFGASTHWKRPAQPAEIAPSYVFLASDDGRYYTGETLAPTGRSTTR